jgi:hypothetical protein
MPIEKGLFQKLSTINYLQKHLPLKLYLNDDAIWIELNIYIYRYLKTKR